jgi:Protein of unknown function (DUF1553)/Protein of unknown function (DUF1549)/Planctomycete cytochrome C
MWLLLHGAEAFAFADVAPDFNREVRPILANRCFKCHGPATQKAGLRLDALSHAKKQDAVVPGKPEASGIIERVKSDDADLRMPPPEEGDKLTAKEADILSRWIGHGAAYDPHWAFVSGKPSTSKLTIDDHIAASLAKHKITPTAKANRRTLIRRVTLDLIGLLPTTAEVEAFVADDSPTAYADLVSRLLASPHYGERQARHWLDLARYADSNGYTVDGPRSIWPYRDWVITALNADMPFDEFTLRQLAGDLLPESTTQDRVATGFLRNTPFNEEGGTDPEQFRVERTIDRTNTLGVVWLGMTVGCAQCHDHKYDPISQKEYFQLYAFFDNLDEPTQTLGGTPELEKQINEMQTKANELKAKGELEAGQKVDADIKKLQGKIPTTLITRERAKSRTTHLQIRGDFLRKGEVVVPGYPKILQAAASKNETRLTRLDLARWLTSPENPLTARVVVNRAWQQFFGKGLVETENDFGMQGNLPSHPELLDDLAREFVAQKWSMKALHRSIVLSDAYQRDSRISPKALATDPGNKLLARQSRFRVEAEIIRDLALCASGLLTPKIGGPGVFPPLPAELFTFTQTKRPWVESQGEARFRRGMYTYIWRQSQHHLLTTFDGADAQTACSRRNRSNTPLQALHLANDPAFQEFSVAFGKRIVKDGPEDDRGRIEFAYEIALSRKPTPPEMNRLLTYISHEAEDTERFTKLARLILNLDEFITRE